MKLKLIHTNDVHSNFENFAKASSLINQHKDDYTLLLDGGDFADFKSIELQGTRGMAAIEMLEYVGYDALTIGNNEMFNGVDTLEHMASNSSFSFISNNLLRKDKTRINGVVPSTIIEKNGLRILITGSSPDLEEFNDGIGVHIRAYKEAIAEEIKRHQGEYDICVLLNHVGTFADDELVEEMSNIDIIISAHDHKLYPEAKEVNGTIMNSAGNYGEHVGIIELEVTDNQVRLVSSMNLPTTSSEKDQGIHTILKRNKEKAIEVLRQPIYSLDQPLWHDVMEENPITNLIADGLKDMLDCDIALINSGIVNAGVFSYLSEKKLIEICPSPLNPTTFELKGKDLKRALEQSLDAQVCLADGRGPGFRGKYVGRLHVSGAFILHNEKGIIELLIGGKPVEDATWYTVASSDYLQRGSGYEMLANNRNEMYSPEEMRDVIKLYANRTEFMVKAFVNRWKANSEVTV